MTDAPKSCATCRSSFIPQGGTMVCRRYPPTSHLVGSRTIGMDIQPLFQSVFPIVNGDFVCDEHKLKVSAMAVDGNVTTLQPQERE